MCDPGRRGTDGRSVAHLAAIVAINRAIDEDPVTLPTDEVQHGAGESGLRLGGSAGLRDEQR